LVKRKVGNVAYSNTFLPTYKYGLTVSCIKRLVTQLTLHLCDTNYERFLEFLLLHQTCQPDYIQTFHGPLICNDWYVISRPNISLRGYVALNERRLLCAANY